MNKKRTLAASLFLLAVVGVGSFFSVFESKAPSLTAQEAVQGYLIDQHQQIPLQDTSLARTIPLSQTTEDKGALGDQETSTETSSTQDETEELPTYSLAEYFRFLQTELAQGNTPSERTASISEHLFSTLPNEQAEELIELYEKFTTFEQDAMTKAKEWDMPETADETLALIASMQQYQQDYFGIETANQLFGAEMKVMEYNARRAIIINDLYSAGTEKEQLLERLGIDMWGEEDYRALNQNKDPYDILDEKLLIYGNELAAVDPETRKEEIKRMRENYLPPGY